MPGARNHHPSSHIFIRPGRPLCLGWVRCVYISLCVQGDSEAARGAGSGEASFSAVGCQPCPQAGPTYLKGAGGLVLPPQGELCWRWGRAAAGRGAIRLCSPKRSLEAAGGCGTPTKEHLEGCHHHKRKFARLPLQHTLGPACHQVPIPATLRHRLALLRPIPWDPRVATPVVPLPLAPIHLDITPMAPTHQGITPTDTPHQGCRCAHHARLAAIRSIIRSTRRNTRSPAISTMGASTPQAAQAAVLTLTKDDISYPPSDESTEETKYKDECPMRTISLLVLFLFPFSVNWILPVA
nr:PREDICTED: uncharacterized protein LOC104147739 [Struthio camelus australis]